VTSTYGPAPGPVHIRRKDDENRKLVGSENRGRRRAALVSIEFGTIAASPVADGKPPPDLPAVNIQPTMATRGLTGLTGSTIRRGRLPGAKVLNLTVTAVQLLLFASDLFHAQMNGFL